MRDSLAAGSCSGHSAAAPASAARRGIAHALVILLLLPAAAAFAAPNVAPPEFTRPYLYPQLTTPGPREALFSVLDVAALLVALSLAAYFALKTRSRRHLWVLIVFSLLYFGFYRRGCICPVGAIQNAATALFNKDYALPWVAGAFFLLPLVFALFFGRVFCAGVCPLGAAQEIVLLRPVKVPSWLDAALGTVPYLYLGLGVLLAATECTYLICRYDPFVLFFRLGGSMGMLLFGATVLLLATVVGRPYCRYLCPYGALLRLISPLSRWQVRITPDACVTCHLCAEACPYAAIKYPTPDPRPGTRREGRLRLAVTVALLPPMMLLCAWLAALGSPVLARQHYKVRLAERIWLEENKKVKGTTDESDAFRAPHQGAAGNESPEELYREAAVVHRRMHVGAWVLGAWMGLVFGLRLIGQSIRRHRREYEVDAGACVACTRCYASCPVGYDNPLLQTRGRPLELGGPEATE